MKITHVIPQVGYQELTLYDPAVSLYQCLKQKKEWTRLNKLRHLGAYAYAVQGARLARWDYSVAMLYYSTNFKIRGMQSKFRIGNINFTSGISALQALSLIWNIGHLPGTFAVEKGVCRYLSYKNSKSPVQQLDWRFSEMVKVKRIIREANALFLKEDYFALSRILCIYKLLCYVSDKNDALLEFTLNFAAPFLLGYDEPISIQWYKLRSCFKVIRHLAYLTIDAPMSGIRWAPNIPLLVESLIAHDSMSVEEFENRISEILSPFERATYDEIYHREDTRKEAALLSESAYRELAKEKNSLKVIDKWLKSGLKRELALGKIKEKDKFAISATVRLRSHFIHLPKSYLKLENSLRKKKFGYPAVFEYKAWNSSIMLEPNEIIIDVISKNPNTQEVGRLIAWLIKEFDNVNAKLEAPLDVFIKKSLLNSYKILLSRAVELKFNNVFIRIIPWNFKGMGLFNEIDTHNQINIWASNSNLSDPFTKHLIRKRGDSNVESRDEYQEVLGLRELRKQIIKEQKRDHNRNKYLVVAGSVTFCNKERDLIEYDGGLLKISPKNGYLTWYGLESKNTNVDPKRYLGKKLKVLGVKGKINGLTKKNASVDITL